MYKPIILDYYDYDKTKHDKYLTEKKVYFKLNCKYCSKEISAAIDITSNWVSHIKAKHNILNANLVAVSIDSNSAQDLLNVLGINGVSCTNIYKDI